MMIYGADGPVIIGGDEAAVEVTTITENQGELYIATKAGTLILDLNDDEVERLFRVVAANTCESAQPPRP